MLQPYLLAVVPALSGAPSGVEPPRARDGGGGLPVVRISADDTVIDRSCRVEIAPGAVIRDAAGDGVILVRGSGIDIEFAPGSVLRGAAEGEAPDTYSGVGIRIEGQGDVTLRNIAVSGFKAGVWATGADRLLLEDSRGDDLWRHRLGSTPVAEDPADWLWPHRNDANEWLTNYGAAFYIEDCDGVTVRRCRVRRGQNGLVLDRVNGSRVYDNDFSFLSGWGLAMWRSSLNTVSRNALDFCVRGYSHGVYNRGQDSAGILMFEQCSNNLIAENSATHGGDGFFGFGGHEALGETPPPGEGFDHTRKGCNDNLLIVNDFSYAPAHGIEMTFSFGNRFVGNRLVENAICGVWGGYSQGTLILGNEFMGNGLPGRREGGGVNIEHGHANEIVGNTFIGNTVGVSLWWDNDEGILRTPWARANHKGSSDNRIRRNRFEENTPDLRLRRTTGTLLDGESADSILIDADQESAVAMADTAAAAIDTVSVSVDDLPGDTQPVGARAHLRGRDKIIMGQWGPWDHEGVLVREYGDSASRVIEVFGAEGEARAEAGSPGVVITTHEDAALDMARFTITPERAGGVVPFDVTVTAPGLQGNTRTTSGTLIGAEWTIRFFPWTVDPREDLAGWRAEAHGPEAVETRLPGLELRYGGGGPGAVPALGGMRDRLPWRDRFGTIATTTLDLPKGRYRLTTLSDDGVRVVAAGRPVIENWTWHGPTRDRGEFVHEQDGPVALTVEHFEIDGHAVLELGIERLE